MSNLIKVADWAKTPRANIIFVHGLGGHAYDTWRRAPDDDSFWPLWLVEDVEGISVWTLAYAAPASNWMGTAMPLQDRVGNVRARLFATPSLQDAPGLIVKWLLLDLHQQKDRSPESAALLDSVTQVVFMATPHTGSWQGTFLDRLRFLAWPSSIAYTLVANDPTLRGINVAYRGLADERRNVLRHRVFYETQAAVAGVIVDEASADPGLPGDPPIAIDADHIQIVKPSDRSALQCKHAGFRCEKPPARGARDRLHNLSAAPDKVGATQERCTKTDTDSFNRLRCNSGLQRRASAYGKAPGRRPRGLVRSRHQKIER